MAVTARAFFYLSQLEQLARRRIDECLQPEGLTAGQYLALSLVVHLEPVSSADLARRANITAQSMGEFMKALENKGFVERQGDTENRRVIQIRATPAGRKILAQCESDVDKAEQEFFSCLDRDEMASFRYQMSRIRSMELKRRAR